MGHYYTCLKVAALAKGRPLRSHDSIKKYALELRKTGFEDIYEAFSLAQALHGNFYETGLSIEEVAITAEKVKEAVNKLLLLTIPEESTQ